MNLKFVKSHSCLSDKLSSLCIRMSVILGYFLEPAPHPYLAFYAKLKNYVSIAYKTNRYYLIIHFIIQVYFCNIEKKKCFWTWQFVRWQLSHTHISPFSHHLPIPLSMLSLISIKQTNQQTCKTKELIHIIVQAYQVTAPISTTTNLVHLWYTRVKYTGNNAEIYIKLYIKIK